MARAKSRVGRCKFYRYVLLALLTALWCLLALPMVAKNTTRISAADRAISMLGIQSLQLPSTVIPKKDDHAQFGRGVGENQYWVAADSRLQRLPNLASHAQSLERQARAFYEEGRFSEASAVLEQTLQIYQASGDTLGEAVVRSNLALNYQQMGRTQEAMQEITRALELVQNAENSPEQVAIWAQSLDVKASLQLAQGEAQGAVDNWEQAAARYNQLGDTTRATLSRINQMQALQALGFYRRAISTLAMLKDTLQNQPDSLAKVANLRSLGDALLGAGDFQSAKANLQGSLKIAQNLRSPDAVAATYMSLGNLARVEGNIQAASEQKKAAQKKREEALDFYQQASVASVDSQTQAQVQLNRLRLLVDMERWNDVRSLYPQVQGQITNLPLGRSAIYAQVSLAQSLIAFSHRELGGGNQDNPTPQDIAQILSIAYQQAEQLSDKRSQAFVLGTLGHLYELQQQWSEAEKLTKQSLVLSHSLNAPEIDYRFSWQLGRLLKQQGKYQEATAAYQEAFDTSLALRNDLVAVNPDMQFSFRQNVEPVYREFVDLLLTPPLGKTQSSQENLQQARKVLEALKIAELQNFLQQACESKTLEIDRVVDQKDSTTAVIYPIILDDRLEVILKLPKEEKLYHHFIQRSRADIEQTLRQLRINLEKNTPFEKQVQTSAKTVYDWLIEPLRSHLDASGIQTLIFVLDGALRTIPMSALYDGERYLIETYATSLVLGLEVRDPQPLRRQSLKVLAAGLSNASKAPPLPNVKPELDEIKKAGFSTEFILDQAFTEAKFSQVLNSEQFQVVHLATHGQFGANRENTYLLAADGAIYLDQLGELFRMRGQTQDDAIELLVLSACKTASGNDRAVLGIAGTIVQAGARSAIAGLWSLADDSSILFAQELYKYLGEPGITRAEALRRTQMAFLKTKKYKHPRFWAPYVLVGSWL